MKKHKKSYCRCLCVILCALLLTPLLAAVPAYAAAGDMYSYNGNVLPDVSVLYDFEPNLKYIFMVTNVSTGQFTAYVTVDKPRFYLETSGSHSGQICIEFQSIGYSFKAFSDSTEWEYVSNYFSSSKLYIDASRFIWSSYDLIDYKTAALLLAASDPVLVGFDPTVPTLTTSFDGQVISLDAGSLRFFITATNVNGTLSCQWYVNGAPISGEWSFIEAEPGVWLQGWVYTPVENGTREIYCIVTNTIGDKSESVSTGTVIVHYGVSGGGGGSGDLSEVTDKLDVLDMEISDLKQSVQEVQEGIDSINDALKVTDPALDDAVGIFDEGSAEVDSFEQQQWQYFEQNSHVVTDQFQIFSDTGTMVGAFRLVSGIVQNTFNALGPWQPVLTIPIAIGLILFIWSRTPGVDKPRKTDPVSKANRYQGSPDGPGEFRGSQLYDSDRDRSPL